MAISCSAVAQTIEPDVAQAFQLAAGHYQRSDWDEATEAFESIIQNHAQTTESDIAHFFLGEALMQREEYQKAYLAWQNYLSRQPNGEFSSRAAFRMGEAAMRLERFPQSIRLLETFVNKYPEDSLMQFALAYLGEMRLTRDEPQLAQRVFEASLRIQPSGQIANQCRFGLARSLQIQGNMADALNFYSFIIQEPDNPLVNAARLESGIIHFASDQHDLALDMLSPIVDSIELTDDSSLESKAHYWLGRIALTDDDFKTALDHFRKMDCESVEDDIAVAAWFDGSIAATRADQRDQAESWLARLATEHPDHDLADDAMFLRIRNAFDQSKSTSASELADQFLQQYKESPFINQVVELIGQQAYENQQYAETVSRFTQLLETKPDSTAAHQRQRLTWSYYTALGKIGLGQFEQAETILQSIASSEEIQTRETDPESLSTLVEIALATTRFSQNKFKSAIENYEAYLEVIGWSRESMPTQNELIFCYAQVGEWDKAQASFERATRQNVSSESVTFLKQIVSLAFESPEKSNPEFWYSAFRKSKIVDESLHAFALAELAWLKLEQKDTQAADRLFDELLDRFPSHPAAAQAGIARAKRFESAKNYDDAASAYAQVAENFADQPSGTTARLRHAYTLHKIGTEQALARARKGIDAWIEQAQSSASTTEQRKLLAEAIYQSAWICEDQHDHAQRDRRFEELVRDHTESKYWPDAAYRVANQYTRHRKFDRAIDLIKVIQTHNQTPPRVLERTNFLLGQVKAKQRRWADAETVLQSLIEKTGDVSLKNRSSYWLAESLYRQNKFSAAERHFAQLQETRSNELNSLRPWILLRLAQCLAKTEKWQDAASTAKTALEQHPDFSQSHEFQFFVARGHEDSGLLNDAIEGYQRVIDSPRGGSTETAAIAQWRIGEIRFHQEDFVAAIKAYYRVDSIFGYPRWRSAALLQAGKCQEHLENWKHAEKLYRQLLKLFPDNELAADAQDRLTRLQSIASNKPDKTASKTHR